MISYCTDCGKTLLSAADLYTYTGGQTVVCLECFYANQSEKPESRHTRASILDTAKEYVTKDRAATHGDMEDNFETIACLWSAYLKTPVAAYDVASMMTLLKIARIASNKSNPDNWIDAAGYMACGGEIACK